MQTNHKYMKKLLLFLIAALAGLAAYAQPNLTVPKAGTLSVTGTSGSTVSIATTNVSYLYNTADNYVFLYNAATKETLLAGVVTSIKHDGVAFASLAEFRQYALDNNVAVAASGGGSSGGDASAANQQSQITIESGIRTAAQSVDTKTSQLVTNTSRQPAVYTSLSAALTTTLTALPTAAGVMVEIKNNALNAVDLSVVKSGGAAEVVPAGSVVRFEVTNANQLTVAASSGTPTVFYRLYTQLAQ
jgi:hypothetical protein